MSGEKVPNNTTEKINNFIRDLSKDSYKKEEIIDKSRSLLEAYPVDKKFRHSYSSILGTIMEIKANKKLYNFQYLMQNIEVFKEIYSRNEFKEIQDSLMKLYDHIALETARLDYLDVLKEKQLDLEKELTTSQEKVEETTKRINEFEEELLRATTDLTKANQNATNMQTQLIAILSIFSAIILAFMGGISFTTGALSSMHQSSIYKVTFTSTICGFVVFNTVLCLLYIVARMVDKDIYSHCTNELEGDCINGFCEKKCWGLLKIQKRLPYVFWVNVILVALLFTIVVAWFCDFQAKRLSYWHSKEQIFTIQNDKIELRKSKKEKTGNIYIFLRSQDIENKKNEEENIIRED